MDPLLVVLLVVVIAGLVLHRLYEIVGLLGRIEARLARLDASARTSVDGAARGDGTS